MRLVSTVTRDAVPLGRDLALGDEVVDLGGDGADLHRRVDQAGGADDLFGEDAAGALHLPGAGRGGDVHGLRAHRLPLLEAKRAVVDGRRQAEAELGQRRLAVEVAAEHAADLRHGDVAFVDEHEAVVGQVFEQGGRRLAGGAAGEVARVVLDAGARAGGHHHLDVEQGALFQPLGFQHAAGGVELFEALVEVGLDALDGLVEGRLGRDVVRVGVDLDAFEDGGLVAGERVELDDLLQLVAEERQPPGAVVQVGREHLDRVAAHPERAALEGLVVALVLQRDEVCQQLALGDAFALVSWKVMAE
jgi:hypothetical protein